jgi:flavodoxin
MRPHTETGFTREPATETMLGRGKPIALGRRSFLRSAVLGTAGVVLGSQMSGCSVSSSRLTGPGTAQASAAPAAADSIAPAAVGSKILLAYFSRAGENYYYGGRTQLAVGNTEVLASKIAQSIQCDVHRIVPVDPYSEDYEETRDRNVQEQRADARPAIANPLASIASFDTILLGSPIWNVRTPMILSTFVEQFDFAGKTVVPFVTYAVSGLGTTVRDYAASCPGATIGEGLAVQGEEVGDGSATVDAAVEPWLRRIGLLTT